MNRSLICADRALKKIGSDWAEEKIRQGLCRDDLEESHGFGGRIEKARGKAVLGVMKAYDVPMEQFGQACDVAGNGASSYFGRLAGHARA